MDVFVVMIFTQCEDRYYGYKENMDGCYGTFEEAKTSVDEISYKMEQYATKYVDDSFIQIIRMKMGDKQKEIVFDSNNKNA